MSVTEMSPFNMSLVDLKQELRYYRSEQATRPGVTIEDLVSVARTYRGCQRQASTSLSKAENEESLGERRTQTEQCRETGYFRDVCDGKRCNCKEIMRSLSVAREKVRYSKSVCQKLEELIDVIQYCIAKISARSRYGS